MRASLALAALPALGVAAQEQFPFLDTAKAWFDKAQDYVKAAAAAPGQAASAKVAEQAVTPLTWANWKSTLVHSGAVAGAGAPETWMVYVTGGNKTCHGKCARADAAWNNSVPSLIADPTAPYLASVDCEKEEILCGAWGAACPSIWTYVVPQPRADQSKAPTRLTILPLNFTSVTAADVKRVHTEKLYLTGTPYEGALHPIDGWLAEYGLTEPVAFALYYFSMVPSWLMMVVVSMASRYFVSSRFTPPRPQAPAAGGPAGGPAKGAVPAAAPRK